MWTLDYKKWGKENKRPLCGSEVVNEQMSKQDSGIAELEK